MQNQQAKHRRGRLISWILVFLCISAILLIVPLARTIQRFVEAHWGRSLFGYVVLAAVGAAFITLTLYLLFRLKIRSPSRYIWLLLVSAAYVYSTIRLWRVPVEAIHFLEYGLLGFFLFRALKYDIRDRSIYATAFLIGSFVGIFDEILQWIVPLRIWDIRDVGLNALSSGLFQIGLWKGIRPKGILPRIKPQSLRILSLCLGANILLLGLCQSNTPPRVSSYTKQLPALAFLEKEEPMNRFKHRIEDQQIGEFHSLLSPEELLQQDRQKAQENGRILESWKEKNHQEFKRFFHPLRHPFLYELRFHVEIRNRSCREAEKAKHMDKKKRFFQIAYKENLILEKYYGRTLAASSYRWDKELLAQAEEMIDKSIRYKSPISFGPVFPWSEKTMWILIFGFLITLALCSILYSELKKA